MDEKNNVVFLGVVTTLDVPSQRVLDGAKEASLEDVVVIGWDEGGEFYFASSKANGAEVLWLLEKAKKKLLEIVG
jgi:hypothetical protein